MERHTVAKIRGNMDYRAIMRIIASLILMSIDKLIFNISVKIYMFNLKEETMDIFK